MLKVISESKLNLFLAVESLYAEMLLSFFFGCCYCCMITLSLRFIISFNKHSRLGEYFITEKTSVDVFSDSCSSVPHSIKARCAQRTTPCLRRGNPSPLFSTTETTSGALDQILCSLAQERHRYSRVSPEKGHFNDPRTGVPVVQWEAERAGIV